MGGLAKQFNKALQRNHQTYAAWFPVSNTFKVGDYGYIEGGVFRSIGNIKTDFDVDFTTKAGPESKIDFSSDNTTTTNFVGGLQVPALPSAGAMEAKINFGFNKGNSFVVKANLTSEEMDSKQKVAWALAKHPHWKSKYKVVETTYTGKNCVVIASASGGFNLGIGGSVDALAAFNAGNASADLKIENGHKADFNSVGETGVIALRIFRIKGGDVDFLKEIKEEDVELATISEDVEDDI